MAPFTCPFIKRDNTICGNNCWLPIGCYRHSKIYEKNMKKKPCLVSDCKYRTENDLRYCSNHLARIYSLKYRIRQKYGAEAIQPSIPEAPVSESDDGVGTLRLIISGAPIFELGDGVGTLQSRIHEASVSDSDDKDVGLGLFGD
jgi:hypothetical protein